MSVALGSWLDTHTYSSDASPRFEHARSMTIFGMPDSVTRALEASLGTAVGAPAEPASPRQPASNTTSASARQHTRPTNNEPLALHGSGGDARDDQALKDQRQQQRWKHGQHAARVHEHRRRVHVRHEAGDDNRHGARVERGGEQQRVEKLTPR